MGRVVVGVDAGVSGGICVLSKNGDNEQAMSWRTPFELIKDQYARPVLDLGAARNIVEMVETLGTPEMALLEASAIRLATNSRKTVSGIWWYAGVIDTFLRMSGWPIEYIQPKQWQKHILEPQFKIWGWDRPETHGQWKKASIEYALRSGLADQCLYPPTRTGITPKSPHDGVADAFCIARFAMDAIEGKVEYRRDWIYKPTPAKRIRKTS